MSSAAISARGGSLLDKVGTMIYRVWFGFRDRTGVFRKSDFAEGIAASRFQSHRIYLRTICQEFCNIHRRIALLHKYRLHRDGIRLVTVSERFQYLSHQRRRLRQVRIQNIQTLLSMYPEATLIDLNQKLHPAFDDPFILQRCYFIQPSFTLR